MVRGNWQKRVEFASARRQESKQRKQRTDIKRQWKQYVQNFQASLDSIFDAMMSHTMDESEKSKARVWKMHLWTDTIPQAEVDLRDCSEEDLDEDSDVLEATYDAASKQRRMRSKSMGDIHSVHEVRNGIQGRSRSNSTTVPSVALPQGGKKRHPRSGTNNKNDHLLSEKVSSIASETNISALSNYMCQSYFFTGNCDLCRTSHGSGRKFETGCRFIHGCCGSSGIEPQLSLSHVVSNSKQPGVLQELLRSGDAEREFVNSDLAGGQDIVYGSMDMLYCIEFELDLPRCVNESTKPSDVFSEILSSMQLILASVVYVALDFVLVFDRYRNGLLYPSQHDLITALFPNLVSLSRQPYRYSKDADASSLDKTKDSTFSVVSFIPGTILVHILLFLPDSSIGAVSCVCHSWHNEIQSNPAIWKHMLYCRNWLFSESLDYSTAAVDCSFYRDSFCRHYSVLRDITALQYGLDAILDTRSPFINSKDMTYKRFSSKCQFHTVPDACVSVKTWSSNRTLVAYNRDCTLRLFEAQGENQCKEIICQKIDPYRNTKKRTCRLLSMDLDEDCITCLGSVIGCPGNPTEAFVLLVMYREDFLMADISDTAGRIGYSEDMSKVTVIDVGEAVLHYMISFDDGDHRLLELVDFLGHGGSIGDVEISASPTVVACGHGRFMIDVKISIPNFVEDADEDNFRLIDRKLFLFSSSAGAIVWSGESSPAYELLPRHADMTLSCIRRPIASGSSKSSCFFAVRSPASFMVLVGEIDPSGAVNCSSFSSCTQLEALHEANSKNGGWDILADGQYHSPMIVTPTDIVTADLLVRLDEASDRIYERRTILSFRSRHISRNSVIDRGSNIDTGLALNGDLEVVRMSLIRDYYIALVCRTYQQPPFSGNPICDVIFIVVIVHVPSRTEIFRIPFQNGGQTVDDTIIPCISNDSFDTIGLSLSWRGVVMTGSDVRKMIAATSDQPWKASQRKKPISKKCSSTSRKKDGFSRGQQRM